MDRQGPALLARLFPLGTVRRSSTKVRDNQRSKLYTADDVLNRFAEPVPEVKDIERYVKKVWASKRVQQAFPKATGPTWTGPPKVKDGRRNRNASACAYWIKMPRWSRRTNIVLHELAHTITDRENPYVKLAGHGPEYCAVFLQLVLYMMGREAHDVFKQSLRKHRVRFRPKRQRKPMSPERRAQLVATLALARAKRQSTGTVG